MMFKEFVREIDKLSAKPEVRGIRITDEGSLVIKAKHELVAPAFVTSGPTGVFAGINGKLWTPAGQDTSLPLSLGYLTGKKILVRGLGAKESENYGFKYSEKSRPEGDQHFVLWLCFPKFTELFVDTPSLSGPFHLTLPFENGVQLMGLALDLVTAYQPEAGRELRQFLAMQRGEGYGQES